MQLIAHRGESSRRPENTLPAFELAVETADAIELDITWTADCVPIVLHDERLERTTDGRGIVTEVPWAMVQRLDAGSWFSHSFAGITVPTLEDVLEKLGKRTLLYLEIKAETFEPPDSTVASADPPRHQGKSLAEVVVDSIRRHEAQKGTAISSFDWRILDQVQKHWRESRLGVLQHHGDPTRALRTARELQAEAVHLHKRLVSRDVVEQVHREGIKLRTYTVDSPFEAERYRSWGVDAIFTNQPATIRRHLHATE